MFLCLFYFYYSPCGSLYPIRVYYSPYLRFVIMAAVRKRGKKIKFFVKNQNEFDFLNLRLLILN